MYRIAMALMILATTTLPAGAIAQGKIELRSIAEVELEIEKANGEIELRRAPAEKVVPGDDVIYTITATNISAAPVGDVVVTDPIPEHMDYRDGSAIGNGTEITFSVDGGQSYDEPANLTVVMSDGSVRPAGPQDYTDIRWKFTKELSSGESRWVRFRATLQ